MLLTDGTVLVQGYQGQDWYKLTPDITGSYVNGTWTQLASLASNYDPYAMAEAMLADGRVLIEGGEYNFGTFSFTNLGAVYDPAHNTVDAADAARRLGLHRRFAFARCCRTVTSSSAASSICRWPNSIRTTMTWTALGSTGKSDWNAEEGWTLMPNGTLLTVDVLNNPNSEHYIPSQQTWVSDGSTIANLQGPPGGGLHPLRWRPVLPSGRNR